MDGATLETDFATELYEAALKWVEGAFPRSRRAACLADRDGAAEAVWAELAGLGLLGMMAPEPAGGIDAGAPEMVRVAEAFGRGLLTEPWGPVAVGAVALLRAAGDEVGLAALAAGETRPVPAWTEPGRRWAQAPASVKIDAEGRSSGAKTVVSGAAKADLVLVSALDSAGGIVVARVPAAPFRTRVHRCWDGADAAELAFDRAPAEVLLRGPEAASALSRALDLMVLAACGEALGAMERALDLTLEHLRTRVQFGRPLASNQALRHWLAEAWVEKELARALVTRAAREFDGLPEAHRRRLVAAAKVQAGEAGRRMAEECVQMHGGIGVTEEAEISALHRRLVAIDLGFGPAAVQIARFRGAA